MKASGTGNREISYVFTDRNSVASQRYYRISEYDVNGRKTLSNVLLSSCTAGEVFSVYPNPVVSKLLINIGTPEPTRASIRLFDANGLLVRIKDMQLFQGNNQLELDLSRLPAGVYTVTAKWQNR